MWCATRFELPELNEKLAKADLGELSRELDVGEFTLRDIIKAPAVPSATLAKTYPSRSSRGGY